MGFWIEYTWMKFGSEQYASEMIWAKDREEAIEKFRKRFIPEKYTIIGCKPLVKYVAAIDNYKLV